MTSEVPSLDHFMDGLAARNPGETEFQQAVCEVAADVLPFIQDKPKYQEWEIMRRIAEPDRVVIFRVTWRDDKGNIRVNRGYRVQNNNAIGPYKGGLRFHPSVNLSILKFLAFEQTFKNSLTGLAMGGGKGGSDFNPKGKSDNEVMQFCQSFMTELCRHIGPSVDVPAGDIGVGAREIGYMFGQYKRLTNTFQGVLTGKGIEYGGSLARGEATGYGTVYFLEDMLKEKKDEIDGKTVVISGSGNVAIYAAEKVIDLGGKPVTLSDSGGFIHDKAGIDREKLEWLKDLKFTRRGRIEEYAKRFGAHFHAGESPWLVDCDIALPCATQNEILEADARALVKNGCKAVSEGANMPTVLDGIKVFRDAKILYAPSKAANAGGVAVSGLEMRQNSALTSWTQDEVNVLLRDIMTNIHDRCADYGSDGDGHIDYVKGANIGGFVKVADAMLAFGVV